MTSLPIPLHLTGARFMFKCSDRYKAYAEEYRLLGKPDAVARCAARAEWCEDAGIRHLADALGI